MASDGMGCAHGIARGMDCPFCEIERLRAALEAAGEVAEGWQAEALNLRDALAEARACAEAGIVGSRWCECGTTDTPSHVFCDRCAPPWRAEKGADDGE